MLINVLNIDAEFWLNREMGYREDLIRIEREETLEEFKDWLQQQPIKELKKSGRINSVKRDGKMVSELLYFYGVVSPVQWRNIYIQKYANTSFRRNPARQSSLASMAAWLRLGELSMHKIQFPSYNKNEFKACLLKIKKLAAQSPEDYTIQLQEYCKAAGVAVVYTVRMPKAHISGATRWIGQTPLIQLTDKYKSNDHFWFTFFHEAEAIRKLRQRKLSGGIFL